MPVCHSPSNKTDSSRGSLCCCAWKNQFQNFTAGELYTFTEWPDFFWWNISSLHFIFKKNITHITHVTIIFIDLSLHFLFCFLNLLLPIAQKSGHTLNHLLSERGQNSSHVVVFWFLNFSRWQQSLISFYWVIICSFEIDRNSKGSECVICFDVFELSFIFTFTE